MIVKYTIFFWNDKLKINANLFFFGKQAQWERI